MSSLGKQTTRLYAVHVPTPFSTGVQTRWSVGGEGGGGGALSITKTIGAGGQSLVSKDVKRDVYSLGLHSAQPFLLVPRIRSNCADFLCTETMQGV